MQPVADDEAKPDATPVKEAEAETSPAPKPLSPKRPHSKQ
jgi:hypothetical protein